MTKQFRVLALAGDGVGPEIMGEALRIIEVTSPDLACLADSPCTLPVCFL